MTIVRSARLYFWPIIGLNVLAAGTMAHAALPDLLALAVILSLLSSFGFVLNDLWDRAVDRTNAAGHMEDASSSTIKVAWAVTAMFLFSALVLAFKMGPRPFFIATALALSLVAYTLFIRRYLFVPNVLTAMMASSPLWSPLYLWADTVQSLQVLFLLAIMLILCGREVLMDVRDKLGDEAEHRTTFATIFGSQPSKVVAVLLTVSACVLLAVIVASNLSQLSPLYAVAAIGSSALIIALLAMSAWATLLEHESESRSIKIFVMRSRLAMAFLPVLVFLLWRT